MSNVDLNSILMLHLNFALNFVEMERNSSLNVMMETMLTMMDAVSVVQWNQDMFAGEDHLTNRIHAFCTSPQLYL